MDHSRLKSYILTLVPNLADAEQIAQETSLRLWEQFDRYDPSLGDFSAWARTIAHFQVMTYRKKLSRERIVFSSALIDALAETARPLSCGWSLPPGKSAGPSPAKTARTQPRVDPLVLRGRPRGVRTAAEKLGRSAGGGGEGHCPHPCLLYDCIKSALRKDAQT